MRRNTPDGYSDLPCYLFCIRNTLKIIKLAKAPIWEIVGTKKVGTIHPDVRTQHLANYQGEEIILKAFLHCFSVTWGRLRKANNTELSVYFLQPEPFMSEAFGFEQEVMVFYSRYPTIESRAMQAAESFFSHEPARGRVEKFTCYFVSEADDAAEWFQYYTSVNQESRIVIPLLASELRNHANDPWFIRNKTRNLLYGRDLFDLRLPLEKDTYFFGRSELAMSLFDAVKRSENRGIFGLRKTGKTSLLYRLERMLCADSISEVIYIDCKLPSNRKLRWFSLLCKISELLAARLHISCQPERFTETKADDEFIGIVAQLSRPVLLVFDEIEYISPVAIEDTHWHKDFLPFWQTFWACQSRHRKISAMIVGVNPHIVEIDTVNGVQNPLFGIVSYQFLTGLSLDDTRNMVRALGKRIGLKFDHEAINYIHKRYGGHPLLTRMACSVTNNMIQSNNEARPVTLTEDRLASEEQMRDAELAFYCRHVVSELKQFYSDEYAMLELLSSGQVHDFVEMSAYPEYTKHLRSYGLLAEDNFKRPIVAIPVIGRYVGLELARCENRQTLLRIVPQEDRQSWLQKRKKSICTDMRLLERAIKAAGQLTLFGPNSFPHADNFERLKVVETEENFMQFIDTCNKCFVESIDNVGKGGEGIDYYRIKIRHCYPGLWHALQRIRCYRNENMHLVLTTKASADLLNYLREDLEGRSPSAVPERCFILQQCVLDGLLTGIQIELAELT